MTPPILARTPHTHKILEKKEVRQQKLAEATKRMAPAHEGLAHGLRVLVIYSREGVRTGKKAVEFAERIAKLQDIEMRLVEKEVEPSKSGGHWLVEDIKKMQPQLIFLEKRAQKEGEIDLRELAASVPDAKIVELESPDYQLIEKEINHKMHTSPKGL